MPALRYKFLLISAALLLGFSPLSANEDRLKDGKTPAVADWVHDEEKDGAKPAISDAEPRQPALPGGNSEEAVAPATNTPELAREKDDPQDALQDGEGVNHAQPAQSKNSAKTPAGEIAPARESGDRSGAENKVVNQDGEVGPGVPDHQDSEISRNPPDERDRVEEMQKTAGDSPGLQNVRKGAVAEHPAEAPNTRHRLYYGKIGSTGDKVFPSSPGIDRQKDFWILIFTHYSSQQGVIHDGRIALPIFADLNLQGMGPRTQYKYIKRRKRQLAMELKILAEALRNGSELSERQVALRARMPSNSTPKDITGYARHLHFQRGLSDRFAEGIIRSGAWLGMMRRTMARYGLPEDLVYLPHVESSFENATLSRSGARGLWQFTRGTGRRYMRVGYLVDQRLDPVVATRSAARFLRRHHNTFKSWPLTITSYNHGPMGVQRLIRKLGTRDLGVMIRDYEGKWFRFASKNFYAEFLAAREVAKNYRSYFGELKLAEPMRYGSAKLPYYVNARDAARALKITQWQLRGMNPALRRTIWRGHKRIPKGYVLRIPIQQDPLHFVAAIPKSARYKGQRPTRVVYVRRGDTLTAIGRRYGIPWWRIAAANNIYRGRIRHGQKLMLPLDKPSSPRPATVASLPNQRRKTALEKSAQPSMGRKRAGENSSFGKTTAGNNAARFSQRVPPHWAGSSDDAGLGVSYLSATRQTTGSGWILKPTISIGFNEAGDSSALTHDLRVVNFDAQNKTGRIVAIFGESLGHYAEWGNVSARRLRRLNGFSFRRQLRTGEYLLVSLNGVDPEAFTRQRQNYHRKLESTFFAEHHITQRRRVEVKRGHSAWQLARKNNVPLWLFFRENPKLLNSPMRIGMQVVVPVVEAVSAR